MGAPDKKKEKQNAVQVGRGKVERAWSKPRSCSTVCNVLEPVGSRKLIGRSRSCSNVCSAHRLCLLPGGPCTGIMSDHGSSGDLNPSIHPCILWSMYRAGVWRWRKANGGVVPPLAVAVVANHKLPWHCLGIHAQPNCFSIAHEGNRDGDRVSLWSFYTWPQFVFFTLCLWEHHPEC